MIRTLVSSFFTSPHKLVPFVLIIRFHTFPQLHTFGTYHKMLVERSTEPVDRELLGALLLEAMCFCLMQDVHCWAVKNFFSKESPSLDFYLEMRQKFNSVILPVMP